MIPKDEVKLWWWRSNNGWENFGDALSPYIVERVSKKRVVRAEIPYGIRGKLTNLFAFKKINFAIGSIIHRASPGSNVWGSGILKQNININNANFYAVRGPRTRKRLLDLGYKVPEVYGDPGLLLPKYFNPTIEKKYSYGLIPHYVDNDILKKSKIDNDVLIINLLDPVETVVNNILSCERILSSSLHGIIVSHAYNIPAIWCEFSDRLAGDGIKFLDYFESVGIREGKSIAFDNKEIESLTVKKIDKIFHKSEGISLPEFYIDDVANKLLDNHPF